MWTYTVTERGGCRLITGDVPIAALIALTKGMPKKAVADTRAARILGVDMAMGRPADLDALCADPQVRLAAYERAKVIGASLSESAIEWLAFGDHGLSSQAIFLHLTGINLGDARSSHDAKATPSDPSDLASCRRLLEQVPEFQARLAELSGISPAWRKLMTQWDALCANMDREQREHGGAMPATFAMMRALDD